jgi:uncharacterized membrane protein YjfL (UPF0719 family)
VVEDFEKWFLAVFAIVAIVAWLSWYWQIGASALRCSPLRERWLLAVTPLVCGVLLWTVLRRWASSDVRNDRNYLAFYLALGAVWVGSAIKALSFLGLSLRDDVLERRNSGAGIAVVGALLGLTLCFAGSNAGDGPGWWVVLFCAGLATAAFFLLWIVLDGVTGLADSITIDRDRSAGFRLAGFFLGAGLILGRAVAGNWISTEGTFTDFARFGWPVLPLFVLAAVLERGLRPSATAPARPVVRDGVLPALLYAGAGLVGLLAEGPLR